MARRWQPLPLNQGLFANLNPDAVVGFQTAIENGFVNELGGHTRFPGMRWFANLGPTANRIYLNDFNNDLIAASDKGQVYRINRAGTVENITQVPVSGGRRVIFAKTDRDLLMAAGGPIVRFRDLKTELLSADAPNATHVGWLDNYTIAIEPNSGRFFHSRPRQPDTWDALDTFSADGNPDNINSMIVTPFRELLLGGFSSSEQFERSTSGTVPFYRRWAIGDGTLLAYASVFADNAVWTINSLREWVRSSGQTSQVVSEGIGKLLEDIDDWSEAWMGGYPDTPLHILGQRFIIFQAPHATNAYGTKGVTIGLDYRGKRVFQLYGWDVDAGVPGCWPAWSHWTLWQKVYVGGTDGWIYELTPDTYRVGTVAQTGAAGLQRWLVRTSYMQQGEAFSVNNLRLRLVRGIGSSTVAPTIRARCSRNGRAYGPWIQRSLGLAGQREQMLYFGSFGNGSTFSWEFQSADDAPIHLIGAELQTSPLGH